MSNGPLILQQGSGLVTADIVFVHGLRGDRISTWSKGSVCWPRDLLPKDLPNVRVITWGYDADVANVIKLSSHASIFGHAQSFLRDIARLRLKAEEKTRPIIFVGHSMGGLLIKTALIRSAECLHTGQNVNQGYIYKHTKGLLFVGTPHRGSEQTGYADVIAKVATVALRQPNKNLVEILRQDSDVLEGQRSSFSAISRDLPIACIYETVPMMGIGMVPEHSACLDGFYVERDHIDANHIDMCKFNDPEDIGYQRLAGFLSGFVGDKLDNRFKAFLRHLWFPEIQDRENDIRPAYAETFEWILDSHSAKADSRNFIDWLSSPCDAHDSNRIFWVSGKAGSGKSTVMKYIYQDPRLKQYLRLWAKDIPLECIGFFIWDRGKSMMHKSREGVVRSLLHQILEQHQNLIPVVFPEKWIRGYATRTAGNTDDRSKREESLTWDWSELFAALTRVTNEQFLKEQSIPMRLCMFVDGMDEYRTFEDPGLSENELIDRRTKAYTEIVKLFRQLAKSRVIKLCLSSRPLVEFRDAFGVSSHSLKLEDLTQDDIESYTTQVLGKDFRWRGLMAHSPMVGRQLIANIVDKALGVFLWVVLVTHLLLGGLRDGDRLTELQIKLDSMPVELGGEDGLYAFMMRNIKLEHRQQCFEILQLIRYSRSAPTLLSLEFADGEYHDLVSTKDRTLLPLQVDQVGYVSNRMEDRLISRCAGLVEVVKDSSVGPRSLTYWKNNRVQFMHQTAKDFVEQPQMWKEFLPDALGSFNPHSSLLVSCILELKLLKGEGLKGMETSMDWQLVEDALVYAFEDEQSTNRPNPELFDELDRCVEDVAGAFATPTKRNDLRRRATHWTHRFRDEKYPYYQRGWLYREVDSSFLACAAEHGLTLYVLSTLQAMGCNTRPLTEDSLLLIHALQPYTAEECQLNSDLIEMLLKHGYDPLKSWEMHQEVLSAWSVLVDHEAGMEPRDLRWDRWEKIATMFVKRLGSLKQISEVKTLLVLAGGRISPLNASFVQQQLEERAEQLATTESPLPSRSRRPPEQPTRRSKRQKKN